MTGMKCPLVVTDELPAQTSLAPYDDGRSMAKSLFILQRCSRAHGVRLEMLTIF